MRFNSFKIISIISILNCMLGNYVTTNVSIDSLNTSTTEMINIHQLQPLAESTFPTNIDIHLQPLILPTVNPTINIHLLLINNNHLICQHSSHHMNQLMIQQHLCPLFFLVLSIHHICHHLIHHAYLPISLH